MNEINGICRMLNAESNARLAEFAQVEACICIVDREKDLDKLW